MVKRGVEFLRLLGVSPFNSTLLRARFHSAMAAAWVAAKSKPGISAARLRRACSMLMKEMPIFMNTGRPASAAKVSHAPALVFAGPLTDLPAG
jgi:hypothetical protein